MFLREIVVSADERIVERYRGGFIRRFESEATCVTELYRYLIRGLIPTGSVSKVILEFTDELTAPPRDAYPVRVLWPFSFANYVPADHATKKRMILDALHAAMMWFGGRSGWDTKPFEDAYYEARRRGIVLEAFVTKAWPAPDRKHRAHVYFRFELEAVRLEAVLTRHRTQVELSRKVLGTPRPYPGCMTEYAGDGGWISATEFQLRSTGFQQQVWTVDFADVMA